MGDLIYLYGDRNKSQARNRYLVVSINGEWCFVKKFSGNQLRASSYKVKLSECYRVPVNIQPNVILNEKDCVSDDEEPCKSTQTFNALQETSSHDTDKSTTPILISHDSTSFIENYKSVDTQLNRSKYRFVFNYCCHMFENLQTNY